MRGFAVALSFGCPPTWRVSPVWRAYRGNDDTRQNIPWGLWWAVGVV